MSLALKVEAQTTISADFKGTTESGWVFGAAAGSTSPYLTANTVDAPGDGWLRLTEATNNQATYALWDNSIFSVNAQIQIEMEYTFWNGHDIGGAQNGRGADGMTFFLVDASKTSSTFQPGAYGGSLGYAQIDSDQNGSVDKSGMPGGYLGFGFDNWGNYAGNTEGRDGGIGTTLADGASAGYPNRLAVRGPDDGDGNNATGWEFIKASAPLNTLIGGGQMDFPTATSRPDQSGADYRGFRLTLDANNQLTVEMKFGANGSYVQVFTADLAEYDRPDFFKLGFTAGTGGANEIHEIRNLSVTMTPWQPDAFEWDNDAGTTAYTTGSNWVGNVAPGINADLLFGDKPTTGPQTVNINATTKVNSITFDADINYALGGTGSLTMGDTGVPGQPSINVNDYNGAQGQHKVSLPITMAEDLRINNYSFSTLCLSGEITTAGNDLKVNGTGAINFNANILGSGNLIKNGTGLVTINNNNSDGTAWTGDVTINDGMVVVTANGALGSTGGDTTVNDGGTLAFRGGATGLTYSIAEDVTISGQGVLRGAEGRVGAIYNDGGNNSFNGDITLTGGSAAIGSRDGVLTLSGVIGQSGGTQSLTKLGEGVVSLTGTNTYRGNTVVSAGVLRVTTGSLPGGYDTTDTGSNNGAVNLNGGVLELASNTAFTRTLGTGEERIFWSGDGGFSAFGGNRTVNLSADARLTWASTSGFIGNGSALLLSSNYSDSMITFENDISFNGAQREVRVANGSANVDATLSGNLRGGSGDADGSGGLIKTGDGTLALTGTNDYNGATQIRGGALRGSVGSDSNIQLDGGVRELGSDYTSNLGTSGGLIRWMSGGGLAADTANRTFNVGNNAQTLTWGGTTGNSQYFVRSGEELVLGSRSAGGILTFSNAIDLNGANRTIRAQNSTAVANEATLAGAISNGSLTVVGNGRIDSTAANTLAGTVTVSGAELRLTGAGTMTAITNITVNDGGTFTFDNNGTDNTNRVNNSATVTLGGGTINFLGRNGNVDSAESLGALTLSTGSGNTINVERGANNGSAQLTFNGITRNAGSTLNVTNTAGGGTLGTTGDNPRLMLTGVSTGVLAYATVNGTDFAGYNASAPSTPDGVYALTAGEYDTGAQTGWTSTDNAAPSADQTLTASRTVNTLKLGSNIDVNLSGNTLTLESGGLLSTGANASLVSGGTLRVGTGSDELIAHVYGNGGLNISSVIANNSGADGLTKTGTGTLTLSGSSANTYTGITYVNEGKLVLGKSDNTTAIAGNLIIGDGSGTDVVEIAANEQIADNATVTLNGTTHGSGETILRTAGTTGVTEHFGNLAVNGNAVIDFAGGDPCAPNFLYIDTLTLAANSTLYIRNWIDFTDYLLVKITSLPDEATLARIQFEGYGGSAMWQPYDSEYVRITPVPEPSTYGAILMGAGLVGFGYRRWRAKKAIARS